MVNFFLMLEHVEQLPLIALIVENILIHLTLPDVKSTQLIRLSVFLQNVVLGVGKIAS